MKPGKLLTALLIAGSTGSALADDTLIAALDKRTAAAEPGLIAFRHDIHQHPELGNREVRTSKQIAKRLRELGLDVQTGVAKTGIVAVLKGGLPGPVIGLRSELDALPVTEINKLPWASREKAIYNGKEVGVGHVCGHDIHIAQLIGVAEVLAAEKSRLRGTVKFIFQPAEEGPPDGEEGGAALMVKEGALENPRPDVFFRLHVGPGKSGSISVSRNRTTAAADVFVTRIIGKQTHGAMPWLGIDPVPLAAETILAWQTIPSRQINLVDPVPVISVGKIDAGVRSNIIPGEVRLEGTLRTVTAAQRTEVIERLKRTASSIAASAGAEAETLIAPNGVPAGFNNEELVDKVIPVLKEVSVDHQVRIGSGGYAADDFSVFSNLVPSVGFGLGATPPDVEAGKAAPNHSPYFLADDAVIAVGVKAFTRLIVRYGDTDGFKKP